MAIDILWALLGLGLLVGAGDALVKGAVNLAIRLGVPALVVGLTVVAFGTSAPEMLVSIQAVIRDVPGIALGNVVGSNIANILLVIGIPALISVIRASQTDTRESYVTMLAASVLFVALAFVGVFAWWSGLILLAGLGFMLRQSWQAAQAHRLASDPAAEALEEADPQMPGWKVGALLAAGLVGLPFGADLLVDASVNIARTLGVSETVIGLTLVAVGTSLPELATSVMAAIRRTADVALGNVIGSNMFNLLAIIGVASLVGSIPVAAEFLDRDLWVMLGASLLLAPFVLRGRDIGRGTGAVFIALYGAYIVALAVT